MRLLLLAVAAGLCVAQQQESSSAAASPSASSTDATASASSSASSSTSSSSSSSSGAAPAPPQSSPSWLSSVRPMPGNVQSYPSDDTKIPTGPLSNTTTALQGYPEPWKSPPTDSPEVQAVVKAIDWSAVPSSPVRKANPDGSVNMQGYDPSDPDCWWSATGCVQPKHPGMKPDVSYCPKVGDWGLTYDDGPLTAEAGASAEPNLYNFLAEHKQKAGLFYIGSNVISAPAAAQRGLADGHTLCVHTWSHPAMTAQQNNAVVAELYWTLKAIKEVTGVTTKCWRPPYGDVDDRVRAIAWQMGLTTVLWDEDTDDWNMPGDGGGNLSPSMVDGYFQGWIEARKNGTDNQHGHIVLQHELNNATVGMAEKWLPEVKQNFNVVPWNQCMNVSQPYWETQFVYPTDAQPNPQQNPSASSTVQPGAQASSQEHASSAAQVLPMPLMALLGLSTLFL